MVGAGHLGKSKIVFQLAHSGRQTSKENIDQTPLAPSKGPMDPIYMAKPREMTKEEIEEAVKTFGLTAKRAHAAGADGVQIHSAHGYLVSQFLSPFFNRRNNKWGGSDENRFRFIKEIVSEIRKNINNFPWWRKILGKMMLKKMGRFYLNEPPVHTGAHAGK